MVNDVGVISYSCLKKLPNLPIRSFHQLIFNYLPNRCPDPEVIISHIDNQLIRIDLPQLQGIVKKVYRNISKQGLNPGDTVMLCRLEGTSELNTALLILALSAYGLRVFLPMFLEPDRLDEWMEETSAKAIILPEFELVSCEGHHREKEQLAAIKQIAANSKVPILDFHDRNGVHGLLPGTFSLDKSQNDFQPEIRDVDETDREALIVTTSGTSGRSKLVVYTQGAILNSCWSWETAGLFSQDLMGGRSFTPLITHTMGIRGLFNALWSGNPVCLIKTNYFIEKPEIARYFLMEMKPENITGGPALFQMLLELIRLFPELRDQLRPNLRTLVSSGTSFDPVTLQTIEDIFDKPLHNAFGTTETQQVTNTLLSQTGSKDHGSTLGGLLPGVEIELRPVAEDSDMYSFHVYAPFMHSRVLGVTDHENNPNDRFFATKDLVNHIISGELIFAGREKEDFLKDGFGVKIPLEAIRKYYRQLLEIFGYMHFVPVNAYPGMAALLFIEDCNDMVREKKKTKKLFREINSKLKKQLTPFEYNHRHITAFIIVPGSPSLTPKGNVSINLLKNTYSKELVQLENLFKRQLTVSIVDEDPPDVDLFTEFSNPYLGYLSKAMKMNWNFHRGQGDEIFTYREGAEIAVTDFVGGYGSGLLGHNHPVIRESITAFLDRRAIPLSDQFSSHKIIGRLALELETEVSEMKQSPFVVLFGSTGSEVVEMALHHAYLEWTRGIRKMRDEQFRQFAEIDSELVRTIWEENQDKLMRQKVRIVSHRKGYHGLSSGARSVLGEGKRKSAFSGLLSVEAIYIDDLAEDWQIAFEQESSASVLWIDVLRMDKKEILQEKIPYSLIVASIFEPILGEGGVRELSSEVLQYFADKPYPLIIDEIQTGLGRTGEFLASGNIRGDYYLFSKSLGGNFQKISALLVKKNRYINKIQKYYLSTFSLGALAAQTALTTLSVIRQDKLAELAHEKGAYLKDGLMVLKNRFPLLIQRVGGRGLMIGLQLGNMSHLNLLLINALYQHELLGYLCCAYLLNVHRIRVLPTLTAPDTLRFEPSAYVSNEQIDSLMEGLGAFFDLIENRNTYNLFRFLMDGDPFTDNRGYQPDQGMLDGIHEKPLPGARQIASIFHFAYPTEEIRLIDVSLGQASDTGLRMLFRLLSVAMGGKSFLLSAKNLHQGTIHLKVYSLIVDSAELECLQKGGRRNKIIRRIQQTVDKAAQEGAKVISLGGYTSILTRNGTQIVSPPNTRVITGNTMTAGIGIQKMFKEIDQWSLGQENVKIGLLGATGNIGSLIGREIIQKEVHSKLVLISRRLIGIDHLLMQYQLTDLLRHNKEKLVVSDKLADLKTCNFIVAVSNSADPIIFPNHIRQDGPVLIFDVSIPSAVSLEVRQMVNVKVIPFIASVALPYDPDYVISTCIPKGTMFCCMAEGFVCALEDVGFKLTGRIETAAVESLIELARKQGFISGLGSVKSFKTESDGSHI